MSDTSRCLISISAAAAVLMVLAGCQRAAEEKKVAPPAAWALDESKLQQPIRFAATDLDPSQSACKDLSAYVNGKWLAANAIPGDGSGWGAFQMLSERSLGVRQQLAEQSPPNPMPPASTRSSATSRPPAWTTRRSTRRASRRSRAAWPRSTRSPTGLDRRVPAHDRRQRREPAVRLRAGGGLQGFLDEHRVRVQGGLGLPDYTYYFAADKKPKLAAYETHVAKVLELSGVARRGGRQAGQVRDRVRDAAGQGVEVQRGALARRLAVLQPGDAGRGRQADAELPVDEVLRVAGRRDAREVLAGDPGLPPGSEQDARRRAGRRTGRATCASTLLDDASPYLSTRSSSENFDFYGKTLRGQKEQQGALEARAGRRSRARPARRSASCTSRSRSRPSPRRGWRSW